MVTGIYRRKGVKEKANSTTFISPHNLSYRKLTNLTRKSTKTSQGNPANRKIHSQALVMAACMCVLCGSVC